MTLAGEPIVTGCDPAVRGLRRMPRVGVAARPQRNTYALGAKSHERSGQAQRRKARPCRTLLALLLAVRAVLVPGDAALMTVRLTWSDLWRAHPRKAGRWAVARYRGLAAPPAPVQTQ